MARTVMDSNLLRWECYVTGGQPDSPAAARIFFTCLDAPLEKARYVEHESGNVAEAQRALLAASDEELLELLGRTVPND